MPEVENFDEIWLQPPSSGLSSCSSFSSVLSFGTPWAGQVPNGEYVSGTIVNQEQAVLMASHPEHLRHGRYVVRLWRTSYAQLFCLEFFTGEAHNGQLLGIFASHDLPFIGMSRFDRLLSINGVEPRNVQECCSMMKQLLSLVLVLQSKSRQSMEPVPQPKMESLPPLNMMLLTIRKETLENDSDFTLTIRRPSPKLKLDLPFSKSLSESKGHRVLLATCDMPQLEILAGDQLLSVNGIHLPSRKTLGRCLDTVLVMDLKLRRNPGMGKPPPSEQLGTYQQPPEEQSAPPTVTTTEIEEVCMPNLGCCTVDPR